MENVTRVYDIENDVQDTPLIKIPTRIKVRNNEMMKIAETKVTL